LKSSTPVPHIAGVTMTRRYYTPVEADRSLPLVRSIARVWTELQAEDMDPELRTRMETRVGEVQERFDGLIRELDELGVELKDPFQGLLDFRAERGGREVYLCWRLGEDRIGHWHDLEAGFAGRKPIETF
jgi:hypothetical protein